MSEENKNEDGNENKGEKSEFKAPASQEDFDRMVADRLTRERAKFADYDEIKKKAADFDKVKAEAMTEQEKAVAAARSEGEQTATEKANARVVKAEAKALAGAKKFRDPADAVAFVDLSKVAVDADGEPDGAAITKLLDELATKKPYLIDDGKKVTVPPAKGLKSGAASEDTSGMTGKQKAAAALRSMRTGG